ncbi:MAG: hypothetical protein JOZ19_09780 [Rubrobacter sp.]|nr:hypothetical protein [Rubrobacter sp.]
MERAHVLVLAKRMSYRQTVRWVEENPEEYTRGNRSRVRGGARGREAANYKALGALLDGLPPA